MRLFKLLYARTFKKRKLIIILTMISYMLAVSLLSTVVMINDSRSNFMFTNGHMLNRGDLSLEIDVERLVSVEQVDSDVINSINTQLLDYLNSQSDIAFYHEVYSRFRNVE